MSSVAVIGAGHVGLVTAASLASWGHDVACLDIDEARIDGLRDGSVPILERDLPELLEVQRAAGRLCFGTVDARLVGPAEFVFLCLPTPSLDDGRPDVSALDRCARRIGPMLAPGAVVVTKSTVPVGSTLLVEAALGRSDVAVVSNPEFLREAVALSDSLAPHRIVVGGDDKRAVARVAGLFRNVDSPVVLTDPASAETIKYASNAYLAMKISFANSLGVLCGRLGANLSDVLLGVGYDPRIGSASLVPGPGWGGSCLPKDTAALRITAREHGFAFSLLDAAIEVNDEQRDRVVDAVRAHAGGDLSGARVGLWGLTFKAGTEDLRYSPALAVASALADAGAILTAYDPAVTATGARSLGGADGPWGLLERCSDPYTAVTGAAVLVVLTEWDEFRWLDFKKVADCMDGRSVVDTRQLLEPAALRRAGLARIGVEDL
ncbi:MAG TPA: UDP-glucose/GDP-mannose dehydrogenase family protein [Acidimicrobiales bacterium]